ncbi:MAG: peptidoglycan-binding domain-containing protein [Cycloclasticus sp.]
MNITKTTFNITIASLVVILTGCANTEQPSANTLESVLQGRAAELDTRESAISKREMELKSSTQQAVTSDLLPPNAKTGECYARVWVPEKFKTVSEQKLASEASEKVEVIPARYEWATETIEVNPAGSRLVAVAAVYGTEDEKIQLSEEQLVWRMDLANTSTPASKELLSLAKQYGADLDSATPGMCFHEHSIAAKFENVTEQVLVQQESSSVNTMPAKYRSVEKQVLISDASNKIIQIPATYKTVSEQMLVKPAHTIWKKGTGPIQRIDSATGEIMCLVEVPAEYMTVTKTVIDTPATTKTVEIPAQYKTVIVQELEAPASQSQTVIPAKYSTITKTNEVSAGTVTWHEVHNKQHPTATRTGQKVCLTKTPARYKTVTRQIVVTPATTREVTIPAQFKTMKVQKLVSAASEKRIPIPATYKTVTRNELVSDGFMQWRSILCDTNMTTVRVAQIQEALKAKGFNPGPIDGDVGIETIRAVNAFQKANNLPIDRYLNVETVKALGVSVK